MHSRATRSRIAPALLTLLALLAGLLPFGPLPAGAPGALGAFAGALGSAPAQAAELLFSAQTLGASVDQSRAVATGDFDNDGDLDIVVGNGQHGYYNEGVVATAPSTVYLNNGSNLFTSYALMLYGGKLHPTTSVAVGDLNNDGFLDIVLGGAFYVSDGTYGYVAEAGGSLSTSLIYLNDGKGGFKAPSLLHEALPTTSVALGDIDGDGDLDIVTANYEYPSLVYANNGSGTFTLLTELATSFAESVALGDLNADGLLDIVIGNGYVGLTQYDQPSQVYLNSVADPGVFAAPDQLAPSSTGAVALADLNGDSRLDIVLGNHGGFAATCDCVLGQASVIFYNNGQGGFPLNGRRVLPGPIGAVRALSVGDVNGDGLTDIVTANGRAPFGPNESGYKTGPIKVYFNQRDAQGQSGTFTIEQTSVLVAATNTLGLALADLNGDSTLDLVAANPVSASQLFLNRGGVNFAPAVPVAPAARLEQNEILGQGRLPTGPLATGDMNGDGWLDLVGPGVQKLWVALNNQQGGFAAPSLLDVDSAPVARVAIGDMNDDGLIDLVLAGSANNRSAVLLNRGDGLAYDSVPFGDIQTKNASLALGDLNGDGTLDVVLGARGDGESRVYLNSGDVRDLDSLGLLLGDADTWISDVALGDLDDDGDLDIAASGLSNYIFFNDGDADFTLNDSLPISGLSQVFWKGSLGVAAGDLNGDGAIDVSFATGDEQNAIYFNDGHGGFPGRGSFFGISRTVHDVSFADLNGDGNLDIVTSRIGDGVIVYLNDGAGQFAVAVQLSAISTSVQNVVGDFNRDGTPDIADLYDQNDQRFVRAAFNLSGGGAGTGLPTVSVIRPGTTDDAPFYSTSEIQEGQVIDISYTLRDPESDAVNIRAEYSLNGGGTWRAARPASGTALANLPTDPQGIAYTFPWDTFESGFFGDADNIVFRIIATPGVKPHPNRAAGPYQRPFASATTFPFRAYGTLVRVVRPDNEPAPDALVYWLPAGQTNDGQRFPAAEQVTDSQGYLPGRGEIKPGDRLVALWPLTDTKKFSLYYTSSPTTAIGLDPYTIERSGVQELTVRPEQPLLLFHLKVSLEWDARNDQDYLDQLKSDLRRSSELLYIWSDGQIALGKVTIYHDKAHWDDADVQIHASNGLRPNANQGGIVATTTSDPVVAKLVYEPGQIRMGAVWNRFGEAAGQPGEDWPRAFAHELGHWALFLDEDYLGLDADKRLISVEGCKSPMADPYRNDYGQFRADTPAACAPTLNQQLSGRSNWATIKTFYDNPALGWQLNQHAPVAVAAGPSLLPFALTDVREEPVSAPADTLAVPIFGLQRAEDSTRYLASGARAVLFRNQAGGAFSDASATRLTDLGMPERGEVIARGASHGDRLCVFDNDDERLGCTTIQAGDSQLTMVAKPGWAPELLVTPVTSRTYLLKVDNVAAGLTLQARLYASEGQHSDVVSLQRVGASYTATLNLRQPILSGLMHVWVNEAAPRREAVTDYALGGNPAPPRKPKNRKGRNAPALSPDGQVVLFSDNLTFKEGSYFAIQSLTNLPLPLPSWSSAIGQGYRLIASPNAPSLVGTSLNIGYLEQDVVPGTEGGLSMYYLPENGTAWQRLVTRLDTQQNEVSAAARGQGSYVLISSLNMHQGWNMLSYPWPQSAVTVAAGIKLINGAGALTTIYGYDPADVDPWKVYDLAVPAWVNDLAMLQYGQGYWVHVTQPSPNEAQTGAELDAALPQPPSTFYGTLPGITAGQSIRALVNGIPCGTTSARLVAGAVVFSLDVPAASQVAGCGQPGSLVWLETGGKGYTGLVWSGGRPQQVGALGTMQRLFLPLLGQ